MTVACLPVFGASVLRVAQDPAKWSNARIPRFATQRAKQEPVPIMVV